MTQPAPLPYGFTEIGTHGGTGSHIYIIDAEGRKIGVVWGKREEKPYTAALFLAGANHVAVLADVLEKILYDQEVESPYRGQATAALVSYREALK